jgi:hypothetical protein
MYDERACMGLGEINLSARPRRSGTMAPYGAVVLFVVIELLHSTMAISGHTINRLL